MGIVLSKNSLSGARESNSPRLKKHEFILIQIQNIQIFCLAESRADFITMKKQLALMKLTREETGYFNLVSKCHERNSKKCYRYI